MERATGPPKKWMKSGRNYGQDGDVVVIVNSQLVDVVVQSRCFLFLHCSAKRDPTVVDFGNSIRLGGGSCAVSFVIFIVFIYWVCLGVYWNLRRFGRNKLKFCWRYFFLRVSFFCRVYQSVLLASCNLECLMLVQIIFFGNVFFYFSLKVEYCRAMVCQAWLIFTM